MKKLVMAALTLGCLYTITTNAADDREPITVKNDTNKMIYVAAYDQVSDDGGKAERFGKVVPIGPKGIATVYRPKRGLFHGRKWSVDRMLYFSTHEGDLEKDISKKGPARSQIFNNWYTKIGDWNVKAGGTVTITQKMFKELPAYWQQ
jgi:hypothetical protein